MLDLLEEPEALELPGKQMEFKIKTKEKLTIYRNDSKNSVELPQLEVTKLCH